MHIKERSKTKLYVVSIVIVSVLVLGVIVLWLARRGQESAPEQSLTSETLSVPTPKVIIRNVGKKITAQTLQDGLNDMGVLVTAEYYFTDVISYTSVIRLFNTIELGITETNYCAAYDGTVNAGIDFSGVTVEMDDALGTVVVRVPAAEIFDVDIDTDSFRLISEKSGLGNPVSVADFNSSLAELEKTASEKALERGVLEKADENARLIIRGFVGSLVDLSRYTVSCVSDSAQEAEK